MKKLLLGIIMILGIILFASCEDEPIPEPQTTGDYGTLIIKKTETNKDYLFHITCYKPPGTPCDESEQQFNLNTEQKNVEYYIPNGGKQIQISVSTNNGQSWTVDKIIKLYKDEVYIYE